MKVEDLVSKIVAASNAYYNSSNPIISDEDFDRLVDELKLLDPLNEILTTPGWGSDIQSTHKKKFPHTFLVKGIDDKFQSNNFNFIEYNSETEELIQSAKLDGISGVAYYESCDIPNKNKLVRILTRNNGEIGLDVTESLIYCNIPKYVASDISWVRGEIVTTWEAAKKFGYKHPRNMAAGLANSDELSEAHKYLEFVVYNSNLTSTHKYKLNDLEVLGFTVVKYISIITERNYQFRSNMFDYSNLSSYYGYKYPVDGSILTKNYSGDSIAIKYPTPKIQVKVVKVINQLSSRGRVIPVIEIEPSELSGCLITYCSGFNYSLIKEHGIGPGAGITITRANEVIPDWRYDIPTVNPVEVILPEVISNSGKNYKIKGWNGVHLECEIDKTLDSIKTLISWRCPLGIANAKIDILVELFQIETLKDLSVIASNWESVRSKILVEFGSTYSDRIVELLELINKGYTLAELLESTYTRSLGSESADRLMKYYNNNPKLMLDSISSYNKLPTNVESLMPSYVVGEGVIENIELIKNVLSAGFNIISPSTEIDTTNLIPICMTGKLSKSRNELVEEWAGKIVEVDIGKAKYLITDNPESGSSKNKAANKLGIPVVTESRFREILN